ncbi:RNA-guided endonuclease InsQ/TnpB family protein [Muricoccus nepalensis]|nr:RNA-guided endonuclease TnpB family protein [Roseomonas nepalensis]
MALMLTHRVRAYPTKAQHARLADSLEHTRQIYNAALQERVDCYAKTGRTVGVYEQNRELTELRQDPAYARYARRMQCWALNLVDRAYKAMFTRHRKGKKLGRPRFRGRDYWNTLGLNSPIQVRMTARGLKAAGVFGGTLRLRPDRPLPPWSACKALTLSRDGERWYAHLTYEEEGPVSREGAPNRPLGLDFGLKCLAVTSDGARLDIPRFDRDAAPELRRVNRALSRAAKRSRGRRKIKAQRRRLLARIARRRAAALHRISARVVQHYDAVAIEDLNLKGLVRSGGGGAQGRGVRSSWRDRTPGKLADMLEWKCQREGRRFARVDPRGTTIDCAACGAAVPKTLKDRVHRCSNCGEVRDRDENAARNIRNRAGWGTGGVKLDDRAPATPASVRVCPGNTAAKPETPRASRRTRPDHGGAATPPSILPRAGATLDLFDGTPWARPEPRRRRADGPP